uniref:Undecaprenyl-phosphate glucose phosphotransferase n=1 Tax=Sphingobacterium sp. (strain 21) TaxID=743722 RepID=F4C886_SPHS2
MVVNNRTSYYFIQVLGDVLFVAIAFTVAIIYGSARQIQHLQLMDFGFALFLFTGWYVSSRYYQLYTYASPSGQIKEVFNSINCIIIQLMLVVLFIFAFKDSVYYRRFVLIYGAMLLLFIPVSKIIVRKLFFFLFGKGFLKKRAIVIGDGATGRGFYRYIQQNQLYGYEVIKYINGRLITRANHAAIEKLNAIATGNGNMAQVDEVFVAESDLGDYNTKKIVELLSAYAVRIRIVPKLSVTDELIRPASVTMFGAFPLISMHKEPLEDAYNQFVKRGFDLVFSLFVLIVFCSWLFPIIALCIKFTSKGPVFFRQERWGKRNKRFICYKFRSMYIERCDLDKQGKFRQAKKNDSRITPIGRFLRRTNLDELPQFINVLEGSMSIVGPRPHASMMNKESVEIVNKYLARHQAKPGITGWAQVNGFRGESSSVGLLEARVAHDIWYIENWTFLLDLKIIFHTFWKMVVGDKNAY